MKTNFTLALYLSLSFFTANGQQLNVPASSPLQSIKQDLSLSSITIVYSRPSTRDRKVFGDLVPYDKVWRTGANESTKISFGEGIFMEGNRIPAGQYALYTIPGKTEWTIILSKNTTWWGAYPYTDTEDLLRFKVKAMPLSSPVETFTITFDNIAARSATLSLTWEKTQVPILITADNDVMAMKNIEEAMDTRDKRPYIAAANYYYENDKDMNKALEWINKSLEMNPKAYWAMLLKAKIQLKLKDNQGALATGGKVIALAREDKSDEYISLGEKVVAAAKKAN